LGVIQAQLDELSIVPEIESSSGLDANASSKNAVRSDPAVDSTAIIANLESYAADGFHEVQVFSTPHFAEYDVADRERGTIDRRNRA